MSFLDRKRYIQSSCSYCGIPLRLTSQLVEDLRQVGLSEPFCSERCMRDGDSHYAYAISHVSDLDLEGLSLLTGRGIVVSRIARLNGRKSTKVKSQFGTFTRD